jgi:beta-phosphoglucomutase
MHIIFDNDGVLVDSEPVINDATIRGLMEYGVTAQPEDFLPFVGAGEDRYVGGVAEKYGLTYRTEMKERVHEIYYDLIADKLKPHKGALELLAKVSRLPGKVALASSSDHEKIRASLDAAGIPADAFDLIVSGEEVPHKKPSPDIYLETARRIGATPSECIVIEDAVNGVQAAKSAGMICVAVTNSFSRETLAEAGADYIVSGLSEILSLGLFREIKS